MTKLIVSIGKEKKPSLHLVLVRAGKSQGRGLCGFQTKKSGLDVMVWGKSKDYPEGYCRHCEAIGAEIGLLPPYISAHHQEDIEFAKEA